MDDGTVAQPRTSLRLRHCVYEQFESRSERCSDCFEHAKPGQWRELGFLSSGRDERYYVHLLRSAMFSWAEVLYCGIPLKPSATVRMIGLLGNGGRSSAGAVIGKVFCSVYP